MHVVLWLASIDMPDVAPDFILNNINGAALLACDDKKLEALGVVKKHDRVALLRAVKRQCTAKPIRPMSALEQCQSVWMCDGCVLIMLQWIWQRRRTPLPSLQLKSTQSSTVLLCWMLRTSSCVSMPVSRPRHITVLCIHTSLQIQPSHITPYPHTHHS